MGQTRQRNSIKAVFISDVHLGSLDTERASMFLALLERLKADQDLTHVFLLGDIFDLWLGAHQYFIEKYQVVISLIREIQSRGVSIHYFEGNHDLYLRRYWEKELGVTVYEEPILFRLKEELVRLEHGDQMDPSDRGYIFLRWFLRTKFISWIVNSLPGGFVAFLGRGASRWSRGQNSVRESVSFHENVRKKMRRHARNQAQGNEWTTLVAGTSTSGRIVKSVSMDNS